jgi:hypothetical protein
MKERQKIGLQINFTNFFPSTCSLIETLLQLFIHLGIAMNAFLVLFYWDMYVEEEGG